MLLSRLASSWVWLASEVQFDCDDEIRSRRLVAFELGPQLGIQDIDHEVRHEVVNFAQLATMPVRIELDRSDRNGQV